MSSAHLPEDERFHQKREQERQRKQDYESRQKRHQIHEQSQSIVARMNQGVDLAQKSADIAQHKQKLLKEWEQQFVSFVCAGPMETTGSLIVVLLLGVVVLMNFFLIHAPVDYIISMVFDEQGNSLQHLGYQIATIIVPLALLLLEIYIGQHLAEAKQEEHANIEQWERAGYFMIAFTPLMILATHLARQNWLEPSSLVITLALMFLAGITDAAIILGGEKIHHSLAFVQFHWKRVSLQRAIAYHLTRYRKAARQVEHAYRDLQHLQYEYNRNYPNHPIEDITLSQETLYFLKNWLNKEDIWHD